MLSYGVQVNLAGNTQMPEVLAGSKGLIAEAAGGGGGVPRLVFGNKDWSRLEPILVWLANERYVDRV